jgi:hypothetical protein
VERDLFREEWETILPHIEDSIRSGEFELSEHTEAYVRLFTNIHRSEKKYTTAGFQVGDTVRVTDEDFTGQCGELVTIDSEATAGDYFGVYLDSIDSTIFFAADELEAL